MIGLTSRIFAAYTAGLQLCTSALPDGFTIFDGPQVGVPIDQDMLLYGVQDAAEPSFSVAVPTADQEWADLGAQTRDETFAIYSTYVSWSGSSDLLALADCRARAEANLALIETELREPDNVMLGLGQALGSPAWCGFAITRLQQIQTSEGAAVHTQFVIACQARI